MQIDIKNPKLRHIDSLDLLSINEGIKQYHTVITKKDLILRYVDAVNGGSIIVIKNYRDMITSRKTMRFTTILIIKKEETLKISYACLQHVYDLIKLRDKTPGSVTFNTYHKKFAAGGNINTKLIVSSLHTYKSGISLETELKDGTKTRIENIHPYEVIMIRDFIETYCAVSIINKYAMISLNNSNISSQNPSDPFH